MCLKPNQIVNPSRFLKVGSGQPLFLDVPCGHCSECIIQYRNEWRTRAYFEALDTFSDPNVNAFCLFDTLTYRNGCLPHLSDLFAVPHELDFPCFSKRDIQLFFKRLRSDLTLDGYDVEDNLRFFCVSEYGSDIRRTRRPHYHLLLFCKVPNLSNFQLSQYVSAAWCFYDSLGTRHPIGITDGLPYKSRSHVNYNTFYSADIYRILGYVSKYVTKDFSYSSLVESRLKKLHKLDTFMDHDQIESIKRLVRPFHLQSKGFGWNYVQSSFSLDYFINVGTLPVLDRHGVTKHVSLSMSLKRKLFYRYERDKFTKRVTWFVNDSYVSYLVKNAGRSISKYANRIYSSLRDFDLSYKVAEYALFARSRLIDRYVSPSESIKDSFNIQSGLRNYSAIDFSFMRKHIFTKLDFGSQRDGFVSDIHLSRSSSLDNMSDLSFIDLNQLSKHSFINFLESSYQKYKGSADLKSDGQLALLKLQHRMNHLFKSKSYV